MSPADLLASSSVASSSDPSGVVLPHHPPPHSSASPSIVITAPTSASSSSSSASASSCCTTTTTTTVPTPLLPPAQHFLSAMADHFTSNFFTSGDFLSAAFGHSTTGAAFMANSGLPLTAGIGGGQLLARNSTKTLKCPKCNWHYKYQETLEIHMREKHADAEVLCLFCLENQAHPKLARGETYSCGYKPYRCEVCKYSTTTKGNLSIHMQSDKHVHAVQEMPQSLSGSSHLLLGQFGHSGLCGLDAMPNSTIALRAELSNMLQCLICLNFSADSLADMQAHLEQERGQVHDGDIAALHGFFQCLLCPYSTNLKANFQLHTRTDKHIQRVQLINHLREGSAVLGVSEQFARLGSLKSAVQVRCQPCEEVFACIASLRDHCLNSRLHLANMAVREEADALAEFLGQALIRCGCCPFETDAVEHANQHQCPSSSSSSPPTTSAAGAYDSSSSRLVKAASSIHSTIPLGKTKLDDDDGPIIEGWEEMDAFLVAKGLAQRGKTQTPFNVEPMPEAAGPKDTLPTTKQCPLCSVALGQPYEQELQKHIAEEHKIPAGIAQRLAKTEVGQNEQQAVAGEQPPTGKSPSGEMLNNIASGTSPPSSSTAATADDHHPFASAASNFTHLLPIFPHQCQQCSIAFRTSEQLQAHALAHSPAKFRLWHRCEMLQCAANAGWDSSADDGTAVPSPTALYSSKRALERHQTTAHQNDSGHFCDICVDGQRFESDNALMAHFNTEQHLQKIFNPASSAPCSSASSSSTPSSAASKGQKRPSSSSSSSSKQLPYTCNVCAQSFGQPGTLDTHLRSMAHAQRMSRLADLVQNGELEPSKPIFEQPEPHPAQRSIGEVAAERKSKQNMGKLAAAGGPPHHHNNHHHNHHHHHRHNHASSTSATLIQPPLAESGMGVGVPSSLSNNAVVSDGNARGSSTTSAFDELFKPSNGSWGTNNGAITHQQQQLMAAQMIAQMFAAAQHQQQQQHSGDSSSAQAAATAAAAAAATTLMATAQMAAQMAAASGGFGLLEMFGQPKPSAELNHSHAAAAAEAAHASSTDCGANAASVTNGCDELNSNMNNTNSSSSSRLSPMRASAPPNGRRQQRTAPVADGSGPPRAKRARAGSTPAVAAAVAQQPQRITTNCADGLNGSGRTSRESGVDCLSTSSSLQPVPVPVQQQPPMDLVSVLQALAASSAAGAATTSPSLLGASPQFAFGSVAAGASPATDAGFLMAAAAMAAAGGNIGGPSSNGTMPQVHPPTPAASLNNNYSNYSCANGSNAPSPSPQKRARTRIADEQVKILRQYFDINNSPSEEQIKEMAQKAQLPEKVIKHWFRNTLFKERQRDKDSPYNFSNPPSMGIDLATYHRTGEARIIPVSGGSSSCTRDAQKEEGGEAEGEEVLINNNSSSSTKSETVQDEKEERPKAMPEGGRSTREQEEEETEVAPEGRKDEEEEEEEEEQHHHPSEEREETAGKETRSMAEEDAKADEDDDDHHNHDQEEEEEEEEEDEAKNALDTANFLANIGKTAQQQQQQQQQQLMMPPLFPFFGGASGGGAGSASTPQMMDFASMFSAFPFQSFGQMASSSVANASNGFSPSASAAAQQAQQQFLPPAGSNSNNNSSTFGHLFSGQNLLLNSLMSSSQQQQQQQQQQQAQAVQPASTAAQQQQHFSNLGTPPVNMSQMGVVPSTSAAVVPSGATTTAATAMGSGRRANRTRFTDFQLRTLQQFFDKQAYPKDDDLEMLSKKMGLSPRVIVVWFQNARQKARKVFEQQPHLLLQANLSAAGGHESVDQQHHQQHHQVQHVQQHHLHPLHAAAAANNQNAVTEQQQQQRFVRTSSANFQCVRCKLVFQRYLELIQHQQRVCYAGDEQHLLKSEQHGPMMDGEPEEQQQQQHNSSGGSGRTSSNSTNNNNNNCNTTTAGAEAMFTMEQSTQELLRQLVAAQHNLLPPPPAGEEHQQQKNEIKAEVDAPSLLNKRCATCDQLLLPSRHSLQKHLCRHCHPATEETEAAGGSGGGTLPRAKGMPPTSSAAGEPLDLSVSSAASGTQSSMNNNNNNNNGIIASSMLDNHEEWMPGGGRSCGANSLSPTAFSLSEEGANEHYATGGAGGDVSASSQVCSPLGSYCSTSGMSGATLMPLFQSLAQQQHSPTSGGQQLMNSNGSGSCSKRFRTHLTPMQVFIMKSLFNDYKTPSMQECAALGQKIGLHKRVVQVWFQNARAKERKSVGGGGSSTGSGAESSDDTSAVVPHCDLAGQRCHLCGVEFGARLSMQEHIFGTEHVERVREQGAQMRGVGTSAPPQAENGGTADKEKRVVKVPLSGFGGDEAAAADVSQTTTTTAQQQIDAMLAAQQQLAASQHLPYELMYAAAAASGLSSGALPALLYDPSVFGTPVPALKIPKGVMQQILADMAQRRASTLFTQDGLALAELAEKVEADDFREAGTVDLEVGWGCTQCGNVFQQSEQLQNHQKLICAGAEGNFKLIQTHYQCNRCSEQFGTQSEFQTHCQTGGHHKFKQCSGTTTVVQKSSNSKISGGQGVGD
uniref:Zinc finger homeobox protein 3 n=1 Tax=Globodera rostochiensis TaxID=31243 RepID=A0A914HFL1_GLORO